MIVFTLGTILLAATAQPAPDVTNGEEENAAVPANPETEDGAEDANEVICRRTKIVGSNFRKRICATAREWENLSRRGQATTKELQRKGRGWEPSGD